MKILSILTYYHPHWTGLTAYAKQLAEGLVARGHEVTVLTTLHSPTLAADESVCGVRVVRLPPVARISRGMIAPSFPRAAARLIRQHDVVQIHTPLFEALLVAMLCRRLRRPLVMTHHGDLTMPAGLGNRVIERVVSGFMTQAARLADVVTAYSRDYAEHSDFLSPFEPKLAYVHPPVDVPSPDREAARRWRRELGLEDRRLVGFAGRFVEEKGFDFLLRALPRLLAAEPAAHLVYAGEHSVVYERFYDRCRPLLEAHRDRVSLLGLLHDRRRLAEFYAMCDVFALPSRTDCLALVQVEAMLCGTPVVAADIPGAREAVRLTGMGLRVAPSDPDALADGIASVLRDPDRFRRPPEQIRAHFSAERTLDEYEKIFSRIGDRRAKSVDAASPARQPRPPRPPLAIGDERVLDRVLGNELDMAFRRRARILLSYLELQDGDRVFDGGCGMGFYLMAMGRLRRLRLLGLDGDGGRLRWARRENVPAALVQGDLSRLPLRSASVQKVLLSEVLEHLADDRAALGEIHRILEPGGIVAISVPHANYPFLWDPIGRSWAAVGGRPIRRGPLVGIWTGHRRLYWPDSLAERLTEAGFVVDELEEATHHTFPFEAFLVYGIGKPLFERRLLPKSLRASADRFSGERNPQSRHDPLRWARAVFRAIDRRNDAGGGARKHTFVNVLARARKPA